MKSETQMTALVLICLCFGSPLLAKSRNHKRESLKQSFLKDHGVFMKKTADHRSRREAASQWRLQKNATWKGLSRE